MKLSEAIRNDRDRRANTEALQRFIQDSALDDGFENWRGPIPEGTTAQL